MEIEIKEILKKLLICAYVIIALLAINTIIMFMSNIEVTKDSNNKTQTQETEENTEYDVSMFNSVNGDEAAELFNSEDNKIIYVGRSTCGYCVKFLPVLQQAQKDFSYKTNYLDISTITEEQQKKLLSMDNDGKYLETNLVPGYTPMVWVVKDGKIVDGWVGYAEYDSFASFLEKNGFKK